MPKVSIIVPVYKVPFDYLEQCVDSLVKQSEKDIEIILVNDGSPKEWADKCDEIAKTDSRIKVVHKKNGGLSDARNAGLQVVSSPWVTFVDGDDWIDLDFIEYALQRINNNKADIYFYNGYRNFPTLEIIGKPYFNDGSVFKTKEDIENLQSKCLTNHVAKDGNPKGITVSSGCMKVYNTSFLKENNLLFPIVPYDEDSLFYLDALEKVNSIEYCSRPFYHYRFNEDSITTKYRPKAIEEQQQYLNYIFNFLEKNNKSEEFRNKVWMRVMTQMLVILNLKFFHDQNKDNFIKKHLDARKCFREEPFKTALKNLNAKDMRRNPKIKYYLLKLGLYGLISAGKKQNSKHLKKK